MKIRVPHEDFELLKALAVKLKEEPALRSEVQKLIAGESIPPGFVRCHGCKKLVRDGRFFGTLHLCG